MNKFTDMSKEELRSMTMGGDKAALHTSGKKSSGLGDKFKSADQLPKQVDWRDVPNVVSAVKDQGHCGSWYGTTTHFACMIYALTSCSLKLGVCRRRDY